MIRYKAGATIVDQMILSAVSFATATAFIYRSTPEQYGLYSFFLAILALLASAQNAVINTPLMVLSPRMGNEDRRRFERGLRSGLLLSAPAIVLLVLVVLALLGTPEPRSAGGWVVAVCFIPLLLRDYFRAQEFAQMRPVSAARRDAVYGFCALAGVGLLALQGGLNATSAFIALGAAGLVLLLLEASSGRMALASRAEIRTSFRESWIHSRWSLFGATSSWVQSNTYIYVPFFLLGAREVAFLAATRLIMMPVVLVASSWGNMMRPMVSRLLNEGLREETRRIFRKSSLWLLAFLMLYTLTAVVVVGPTGARWLPEEYRGVTPYLLAWAVLIFMQIVRGNASSVLQASLAFRSLAYIGLFVALFGVAVTVVSVLLFGTLGGMVGLLASEAVLSFLLLRRVGSVLVEPERSLSGATGQTTG